MFGVGGQLGHAIGGLATLDIGDGLTGLRGGVGVLQIVERGADDHIDELILASVMIMVASVKLPISVYA